MGAGQGAAITVFATPMAVGIPSFRSVENPSVPLSAVMDDGSDIGDAWFGGEKGSSGIRVNRVKALGYSAVWRAVNLISNKIAALPLNTYKSLNEGGDGEQSGRKVDREHPAYQLLRKRPNEYMTPSVFKKTLMGHALLRGNGYAYITRDSDAIPLELLPLDPEKTWPIRRNGVLWYITEISDGEKVELRKLPAEDVFHISGLGYDGLCGYDVLKVLSDTIGKAIAARDFGARYFKNDASVRTTLEFPNGMKEEAVDKVVSRWRDIHQGIGKKHRLGVLREGVKLNVYSGNAKDAQLTENYAFDAKDIANVFGLPPHKVGDDSQSSYNSLEQENQALLDDTIDPWLVSWEEEAEAKLLTEEEKRRESHYCKFVRQALMRADMLTRYQSYAIAIQNGFNNADEIRDLEEGNPIPDGYGKTFYRPLNMAPVSAPQDTAQPPSGDVASNARQAFGGLFRATVSRLSRRIEKQGKRDKTLDEGKSLLSREIESVMNLGRAVGWTHEVGSEELAGVMIDSYRSDYSPGYESRAVEAITKLALKG